MEIHQTVKPHHPDIVIGSVEEAEHLTKGASGPMDKLRAWGMLQRSVLAEKGDSFPLTFSVADHKLPTMVDRLEEAAQDKHEANPTALQASAMALRQYYQDVDRER